MNDLLFQEALSCMWAISAHEENKQLVVLYGAPQRKAPFYDGFHH